MVVNVSAEDSGSEVSSDDCQGIHLCHSGESTGGGGVYCRDISCVKWESSQDNQARKPYYNRLILDSKSECICPPGFPLLRKNRAKEIRETVRKTFMDRFKAIRSERDPSGRRMNRSGKCPYCTMIARHSDERDD
jgi:hypothetical protein